MPKPEESKTQAEAASKGTSGFRAWDSQRLRKDALTMQVARLGTHAIHWS